MRWNSDIELLDVRGTCRFLGGESTPIHPATLRRGVKEGRYPPPVKISARKCRWKADELAAFLDQAAAQREKQNRGSDTSPSLAWKSPKRSP